VEGEVNAPQRYFAFEAHPARPAAETVAAAVEDAVKAHLVADVPVGILLSGGLDSSMVAAAARRALRDPPTTLTVRFESFVGTADDEGPAAAALAAHLGCRHVEHLVRRDELLDLWPSVLSVMDQPSIDGFNTYLVSRVAASQGLKVVLSGVGGDELFGGYPSFHDVPRWSALRRRLPDLGLLRRAWRPVTRVLGAPPKLAGWYDLAATLPGAYLLRRGLFLPEEIERLLPEPMAREGLQAYAPLADAERALSSLTDPSDGFAAVHLMESTLYLRNQLLRDSDWASMAHSVELRAPFVDTRLRETVAAAGYEPARSGGKRAVAAQVAGGLPAATLERPKTGFRVPVHTWLPPSQMSGDKVGPSSRALALRILEAFELGRG
jgi:asparagine synthase (glutamine-hydrolysing)